MAIQHPEMVRNLFVIAAAFARDGWYRGGWKEWASLCGRTWNWREEVRALPKPVLLIFADHDSSRCSTSLEFFALFGDGIREPGWIDLQLSRTRLAIIPCYSHYNLGRGASASDREVPCATDVASDSVRAVTARRQ